jgi:hypothetical protein
MNNSCIILRTIIACTLAWIVGAAGIAQGQVVTGAGGVAAGGDPAVGAPGITNIPGNDQPIVPFGVDQGNPGENGTTRATPTPEPGQPQGPPPPSLRIEGVTPGAEPQGKASVQYAGLHDALAQLGMEIEESTEGLVVSDVTKLSLASSVGFKTNDRVILLNDGKIVTLAGLIDVLVALRPGDVLVFDVLRKSQVHHLTMAIPEDFTLSYGVLRDDRVAAEIESLRRAIQTLRSEIAALREARAAQKNQSVVRESSQATD